MTTKLKNPIEYTVNGEVRKIIEIHDDIAGEQIKYQLPNKKEYLVKTNSLPANIREELCKTDPEYFI